MKFLVKLHNELGDNTVTHSVLLFLDPVIPPCFNYINCHQSVFNLFLRPSYWPNQSRNIWWGTEILYLWGFCILSAIVQFHIWFIVCLPVIFAVIWIIQVPIPVKPILGVLNAFWWMILITFSRMVVDLFDSAHIQYLTSFSREVLCRISWWHRWFSGNLNAAAPSWWTSDQDALTIFSVSEMYPTAVICLFWARDSFCVAHRLLLPCHISKKSGTFAIWCNFFCSSSLFISISSSALVEYNTGLSPASNLLLAQAKCVTTTFSRTVSPVVFHCLHPITCRPREKLASTQAPWGMIEIMSRATLERSAYFECVSSYCRHQSVIPGNQNILLISIGSEL